MAGNGPEGRVVDRRGVWWTGRASGRMEMSERGISGPESVAAVSGRLGNSWNAKSAKRGLSACSVEGPLTAHIFLSDCDLYIVSKFARSLGQSFRYSNV